MRRMIDSLLSVYSVAFFLQMDPVAEAEPIPIVRKITGSHRTARQIA